LIKSIPNATKVISNDCEPKCDCGTPAMPKYVTIKGFESFSLEKSLSSIPKRFRHGDKVYFECFFSNSYYFFGKNYSICINGKWTEKAGICGK